METRRICPKCKKQYSKDEVVCEACGERLADITSDFEASFAMVKDPVLLSNGHGVETVYLEEALREKNVPYYVEEGQNAVPTNNIKEGTVEIVPFTNYYVDKRNWGLAKEALKSAVAETRKDGEAPVKFLDMPMSEPEDNSDGEEDDDAGNGAGGPWEWFVSQDIYMKLILGTVAGLFLLGLLAILFS